MSILQTLMWAALVLWGLGFVLLGIWLILVQNNHNRITKNNLAAQQARLARKRVEDNAAFDRISAMYGAQ